MSKVSNVSKQDRRVISARILEYVKPHWKRLFLAMVCMVLVAAFQAAMAYMMKPIVDDIFIKKDMAKLQLLPFVIVLLFVLKGGCEFLHVYLMNYVGHSIVKKIRDALYGHMQMLSLSFFNTLGTGILMARILNDVGIVKETVSNAITKTIKESFTVIFMLGLVFYQNWKLALIAIVVLPFCVVPVVKFGQLMRRFSTRCQECAANVSTFLHETLTGIRIVKAFGKEQYETDRFAERTTEWLRFEIKSVKVKALSSPVMALLGGLGIAFVVWYGGQEVVKGTSTPGTFFSFITAVIMLYDPIRKLSPLNNTIQEGLAASDRIFQGSLNRLLRFRIQ